MTLVEMTKDFVRKNINIAVWLRDDYLSMRGIAYPGHEFDLLEKAATLKQEILDESKQSQP